MSKFPSLKGIHNCYSLRYLRSHRAASFPFQNMNMDQVITNCDQCRQEISFSRQQAGMVVDCPHCGQSTVLVITVHPPVKPVSNQIAIQSKKTTNIVKREPNRNRWINDPRARLCLGIGFAVGVVILAAALANRYKIVNAGNGIIYKTDRITGQTWKIRGSQEYEIRGAEIGPKSSTSQRALKTNEIANLEGMHQPSHMNDYFSGTIYNGNRSVTVSQIQFRLTINDDPDRLYRTYETSCNVPPLKTGIFGATVIGNLTAGITWEIVSAKGF
jgi:hypothetical protein